MRERVFIIEQPARGGYNRVTVYKTGLNKI